MSEKQPTIAEMARAVAKELEDESRWCAGEFARDPDGYSTTPDDDDACRWCARGHAWRLFGKRNEGYLADKFRAEFRALIEDINDRPGGRVAVRDCLLQLADKLEGSP